MNVSVLLKISDKKDEILSVFSLDVKDMLKEIKHITSCVDNSDKTTQEKANEYTNKIKECLHKEDTVVLYRNVMALFYLYNINLKKK
jgi:hemerythrin-like domain-containing protein